MVCGRKGFRAQIVERAARMCWCMMKRKLVVSWIVTWRRGAIPSTRDKDLWYTCMSFCMRTAGWIQKTLWTMTRLSR